MSAAIVIGLRCNYCGKHRSPGYVQTMPGGVTICLSCFEWHGKALRLLTEGVFPKSCQMCNLSHEELEAMLGDRYTGMYVHGPVDGIYQVLCPKCSDALRPKQKDRYSGTDFGAKLKL